jgi:hypothetical protein
LAAVLYSKASPVAIAARRPDELEASIGYLWDSQWPQLKSRFAFSTGSLAPRYLDDHPFDLEVLPEAVRSLWTSEVLDLHGRKRLDPWLEFVLRDMQDQRVIARFMEGVGSTTPEDLRAVASSLACAVAATTPKDVTTALTLVLDLKSREVCERSARRLLTTDEYWPHQSRSSRLRAVLDSPNTNMSDLAPSVREMSASATHLSVPDGWSLARTALARPRRDRLSRAVLEGVASALGPADLLVGGDVDEDLVLELVERNPRLAANRLLWRTSRSLRQRLLQAVARGSSENPEYRQRVLDSILGSANGEAVYEAYDHWRTELLDRLLAAIDQGQVVDPSWSVAAALLGQNEAIVVQRLISDPQRDALRRFAAQSLSPSSVEQLLAPLEPWLHFEPDGLRQMAYALSVGLRSRDHRCLKLVQRNFRPLHMSAAKGGPPDEIWRYLEAFVPSIGWKDWDRCERIRRAVASAFVAHGWSIDQLMEMSDDEATPKRLLNSLKRVEGGKAYLERAHKHHS